MKYYWRDFLILIVGACALLGLFGAIAGCDQCDWREGCGKPDAAQAAVTAGCDVPDASPDVACVCPGPDAGAVTVVATPGCALLCGLE